MNARVQVEDPMLLKDPRRGFRHFGEFAHAVINKGQRDPRLKIIASAPSTFGDESSGADGGFAVPPTFADEILVIILAGDSLMPLCDPQKTSGNGMTYPIDQDPPWAPAPGVVATWDVEGTSANQQKPALSGNTMRLHKLRAFVPLTNELIDDATALQSYLPKKAADAISWKFDDAILSGNGNGQPLGIVGSKACVTQAKDSGQATQTFSITNASNMLGRLLPGSHGRAVYLANISALPAITSIGTTASGYGMTYTGDYVPGTNIPMIGRLLGRPVIPTSHLAAFSSLGDVVLADLAYYRILTRPGGMETAWSMHVYFDAYASAFRARFRCDGQPSIRGPVAPPAAAGSTTYAPFIQLQAR